MSHPCSRSNEKEYQRAAISEDLDRGVGMILAAVDKLGLRDNTYLIYMSDNGGGGRRSRPVRGGKGSVWEGQPLGTPAGGGL